MEEFKKMDEMVRTQKIIIELKEMLLERNSESDMYAEEILKLSHVNSNLEKIQDYYLSRIIFKND